ncbi:hypothetical protein C8F04DRAFT_1076841 [Mycena alexandri]|uniref:Uncharacterized protein n=1 Tax=Mycena alexandri TaxID=1745969 RepID=A0AAD6TC90_9AGAR|nr:hypothetical protein C8F04DRAFT_1076841 [Mycena alexandri]
MSTVSVTGLKTPSARREWLMHCSSLPFFQLARHCAQSHSVTPESLTRPSCANVVTQPGQHAGASPAPRPPPNVPWLQWGIVRRGPASNMFRFALSSLRAQSLELRACHTFPILTSCSTFHTTRDDRTAWNVDKQEHGMRRGREDPGRAETSVVLCTLLARAEDNISQYCRTRLESVLAGVLTRSQVYARRVAGTDLNQSAADND